MATSRIQFTLCDIYIYIYGAHIYKYKISAFISKDDDAGIYLWPDWAQLNRVINIRNNIYNKSPLRISFPGGAAQMCSLEVKILSKVVYLFLTIYSLRKSSRKNSHGIPPLRFK